MNILRVVCSENIIFVIINDIVKLYIESYSYG